MVGPSQPLVATEGDNVVIPCHLEPRQDVTASAVEWSRPDIPSVEYVHVHRNHNEVKAEKMKEYEGRTRLFVEELKHGNVSLMIMNVTPADQGVYKCFIPKLKTFFNASLIVSECLHVYRFPPPV